MRHGSKGQLAKASTKGQLLEAFLFKIKDDLYLINRLDLAKSKYIVRTNLRGGRAYLSSHATIIPDGALYVSHCVCEVHHQGDERIAAAGQPDAKFSTTTHSGATPVTWWQRRRCLDWRHVCLP